MAIGTDSAVEFFGDQDTLGTSSAAVADAAFSIASDLSIWVNDDDAPKASVVFKGTYASAPTANTTVDLYARLLNVQSTNDQDVPDANYPHAYVGSFPLNDVTSEQFTAIDINLKNTLTSQNYEFYIQNNAKQTLSAGWDLYVTPKTIGPHA